ncbi:GHKL domain-containing protein [Amphibacillus sp. Q70]|uniref:GHKL domain-containing protein n=1 Tax=Amphibacillus sp. Q70 TaxID=3453416 RepID=UPI003F830711
MNDVLPDIPRIYTALAEWIACMIYISILSKRLKRSNLIIFSSIALVVQMTFLAITKNLPIIFWIPSMIVAVVLMFFFIYKSTYLNFLDAGYFTVKAFVVAELVASFQWQLHFFFWSSGYTGSLTEILLLISVYGVAFATIWFLEKRHIPGDGVMNIRQLELLSVVVIGIAVFGISNLSFVTSETPFSGQYAQEILNIRTLVDLGGFAILHAYHLQLSDLRIKHELKAVQYILQNQYTQYQQSKESIEMINYKYHDLKNQIIALRAEEDPDKRNAYLTQMEDDIKSYEAQNKTGNHVLDTLLTSKNMYCIKNGITLTSVANGELLNGMDIIDITTIFGNALDNAIEYEKQIEDEEKRLIHVSVFSKKGFVMIRIENYFEGDLKLEGELPKTTKRDTNFHGYGLKSIQYAVQKYDGVVNVNQKDNWFELEILMPKLTK